RAQPRQIDLSPYYNSRLDFRLPPERGTGRDLEAVPTGLQSLAGVEFDVRGLIQLSSHQLKGPRFPENVKGMRIAQKCQRLHFLHSTGWTVDDGVRIGTYMVQYVDGELREIPIIFGEDMQEWIFTKTRSRRYLTRAMEAWSAPSEAFGTVRVFKLTWENPRPEIAIESLD